MFGQEWIGWWEKSVHFMKKNIQSTKQPIRRMMPQWTATVAEKISPVVKTMSSSKTLDFHLHGKGQSVIGWTIRLQTVGSTKRFAYLHEDCHPRTIHRDIKSANILVDYNMKITIRELSIGISNLQTFFLTTTLKPWLLISTRRGSVSLKFLAARAARMHGHDESEGELRDYRAPSCMAKAFTRTEVENELELHSAVPLATRLKVPPRPAIAVASRQAGPSQQFHV
ncbi:protein kinase superfamily protein [Striga asiatica]|uniref:non-specific serine/threonine protein kinase n=1 Tax=Striga asiatica TaxID=4170 RepID=A0A5A7P864_STRAF|nr:protein kinase superfamily protein [Striga asiatica]